MIKPSIILLCLDQKKGTYGRLLKKKLKKKLKEEKVEE